MRVVEVLDRKVTKTVVTAKESTSILDAVRMLGKHKIGAVIVVSSRGNIRGTFTEREAARALGERGSDIFSLSVADVMNRSVLTCRPNDNVSDVLALMGEKRMTHLLILNGKQVMGIINWRDVIKERLIEVEADVTSLRDYITGSYIIGDDGDTTIESEDSADAAIASAS